ncbi:geminin [Microplitis mediator]|uniref:geminin n=1 Tax=Microplitis mediator TaxID=375433 RepID=UPI0025573027|nr:geminin [Microplitis mediator]
MKTGGANVATAHSENLEHDKSKKALQTLQPAAKDKENLVGRQLRSRTPAQGLVKDEMSAKTKKEAPQKDKKTKKLTFKDKACQTTRGNKIQIEVEDLTSEAGPSENYWEVLAERRRIALDDALEENQELTQRIAKLEEEKKIYKEMLDETRALVEVLQEMVGEDRSDINNSLEDTL